MQASMRTQDQSSIANTAVVTSGILFPVRTLTPRATRSPAITASHWSLSRSRRILDFLVALAALLVFALPMALIAICVRLTSKGPALFIQRRVGRHGGLFGIYKFRSMIEGSDAGPGLTRKGDSRITPFGHWLRRLKLDELPQFYNVLRGEMSLVGPRPKLPSHESIVNMPFRPGITGAATLAFRREEEILSAVHPSQLEHFYSRQIMPLKARLDLDYMGSATFSSDLRMLTATLRACLHLEEDPTASIWPSGATESAQAGPQEETSMTA